MYDLRVVVFNEQNSRIWYVSMHPRFIFDLRIDDKYKMVEENLVGLPIGTRNTKKLKVLFLLLIEGNT